MHHRLLFAFLLPITICSGQSVLTTPADPWGSVAGSPTAPATRPAAQPGPETRQVGGKLEVDTSLPGSGTVEAPGAVPISVPARFVGPIVAKSDFERFAEDATGHQLPVYGRKLFDEVPTTFAPLENVPVPADYVLGPGDELLIRAWGKIDLDSRVTIDRNGQIYLPKVGTLNVSGLRYEQANGYLHSAISALFKDFELNVVLGQLRSIQIFVLGSARQPGAYTVSSFSTLVNAIFASGGPSETGSMRRIQLRRGSLLLTEFDIYDLAQRGDKSHDVRLLPGDVIYIPPIGAQVAISGNVNQPGIYELKGETSVTAAIEGAGGLTSLAAAQRVLLERIENHSSRQVEEFSLNASGPQKQLKDGDLLRVFPLSPKFENAVTLHGNVAQAGRYVWKEGMRVSDLIPSRDFLVTRKFWNGQNQAVPDDAAMIDTVGRNSAEINWEYAVIERLDDRDLSTRLIPFRLASAVDNSSSPDNQLLKAGDIVTIFSRAALDLPIDKHALFVRVGGEVNAPGVYRVNPGETLREVVGRAGGLTPHSYLYASLLTRVSTRHSQEEQLRLSSEQMQRELVSRYANATPTPGQTGADQQAQFGLQQAALTRLSSIKPTGRIVLAMQPDAATAGDIPDFSLEDGDTFYIPPRLNTVQVAGAVYNANAFRHQPDKPLVGYLNDAGGATREADRKRIFVIRADGTVVSRQARISPSHGSFEKLKLLPGDAIVVPDKLRVSSKMGDFLQATQLASQLALTAAAINVIK